MVAGVDFMGEEFEEQVAFAKLLSCGPAPLFCPKGQINKKVKTTNRKPKKCCELVMKHIQNRIKKTKTGRPTIMKQGFESNRNQRPCH
jgi:hypothetical protein